jgi:hypothetical protein
VKSWIFSLILVLFGTHCFGGIAITTTSLPNGTVGTAYSAVVKASGGCTPYKWAIASGSMPAGVKATASSTTTSLNLNGTPTTAATYYPTVQVTGCGGGTFKVSYKIVVQARSSALSITTSSLPSGTVGTAYSAAVKATGGCTPYKWSIVSGSLPAGVKATASSTTTSLNLSGTPTTAGTYYPTVQVTGCGGGTFKVSYKIVIQATTSALTITTSTLPNGIVGTAYSAAVNASGGCTPYKWSVV